VSNRAINWAVRQKVPPTAKLVLMVLANYADREKYQCYPSLTRLRDDTGLNRVTVTRCITQLVDEGVVSREQRQNSQTTVYTLQLHKTTTKQLHSATSGAEQLVAIGITGSCNTHKISKEKESTKEKENNTTVIEPLAQPEKRQRPADPAYELFAEVFSDLRSPAKYQRKAGDFVQLANLRKAQGIDSRDSPPDWLQACRNYCASPLGSLSLADLCLRYAVFVRSGVNQYGKPIGIKQSAEDPNTRAARDFVSRELAKTLQPDLSNVREDLGRLTGPSQ